MEGISESKKQESKARRLAGTVFDAFLIMVIITGLYYRFNWVNWSQGTNLHPDEYGLTNTLTQLAIPKNPGDYFNTRLSPLSPYQKYDFDGNATSAGPDNRMRWGQLPITIIRLAGELSGNTGYDEIRLVGRQLSALADALSLLLVYLIGRKLYGDLTGLLAAALSALAVMQIQQSHFMTVDNFGSFFTTLGLYACVQIAGWPREEPPENEKENSVNAWGWYIIFGAALGAALACKVNLLPVAGLGLAAVFMRIYGWNPRRPGFRRAALKETATLVLAFLCAAIVFRAAQPMSFRAEQGDTNILTITPNKDWVDSMKVAADESRGVGGGPPGEQWAHRTAIVFPLTNMVVWGMGLPLGMAAWAGFGAATWQAARRRKNWQTHILPLVWSGGYFLFMGTRWVKSVRYFLPIYPFLCLLAAWGLMEFWKWAGQRDNPEKRAAWRLAAGSLMGLVLAGSLIWATAFVTAIYKTPHTRIQATRWIFENIPGPFQLSMKKVDGTTFNKSIEAPDGTLINVENPFVMPFRLESSGSVYKAVLPHVEGGMPGNLRLAIAQDADGKRILTEGISPIILKNEEITIPFKPLMLQAGTTYFLIAGSLDKQPLTISRAVIANESWDEGLPVPFDGIDPFGQLYRGITMEVRWADNEHKREAMLETLAEADYVILPSQRGIWSTCRIPLTYPMTMGYYRALFDGRLRFELAASFTTPLKLGPLWISDVGGSIAWNRTPGLPLFNHSSLAAEEAFSIYDHPPVWIFKKRADFNIENAKRILTSIDLSKVVIQSPRDAGGDWCPGN